MLTEHEKFILGENEKFYAEINWNPLDEDTNNCKVVKFTFPDGKQSYVKKKHLVEMLFAMGSPEEQVKMIPQKLIRTRWYETVVGVKAKRNIGKGEMINFPIKLSLPDREEEIIGNRKVGIQKIPRITT